MTAHEEFLALLADLSAAAAAYYDGDGSQLMDDATYDRGVRTLAAGARANGWTEAEDFLSAVQGATGDVLHPRPMLSLDNAMDDDEMTAFFARVARQLGNDGRRIEWSVQPKLDGAALSVRYIDGLLDRVATRGDGLAGEDVTRLARHSAGIPARLPERLTIAVNGECVMTHADFAAANQAREAHGDKPFANPRNAVSGTLRSIHRSYALPTTFIAYLLVADGSADLTDVEQMAQLQGLGFTTASQLVPDGGIATGADGALSFIAQIEATRSTLRMDTDGAVVKANDPAVRRIMGEGTRAPRWAIARKFAPDTRETALLDVLVEVGRTGNLSFTAVLEPVYVGGVTISSTTLHNVSEIERKGLRLPVEGGSPQRVIVRRAGEVIPEVMGRANDNTDGTEAFCPPTLCPRGHDLDTSGLIWRCVQGRNCAVNAGIRYAVSRDCLDVEGLGGVIVDALVDSGQVADVADLFELRMDDLTAVDRLGESNATKILEGIELAKILPLGRIIAALGIKGTGRSMSRRIASHFKTMEAVRAATAEQFADVEGIGSIKAPVIVEELIALAPVLDRLAALSVSLADTVPEPGVPESAAGLTQATGSLSGLSICVTGTMTGPLAHLGRNNVNELIERLGGVASSSVSAKTAFLLTTDADSGTGKAKKAANLGVPIVSPEEFAARYL